MKFIEDRAHRTKRLKKLPSLEPEITTKKRSTGRGNAYQLTKTGYRPDLGIVARSGWEANTARVLEVHGIPWEFEPRTFTFPIKRGTKAYLPDFYLPETEEWIEVKGWFDQKSKVKLKRFKKYYPDDFASLAVVIGRGSKAAREFCKELKVPHILFYQDLSDEYKERIPNWEGR